MRLTIVAAAHIIRVCAVQDRGLETGGRADTTRATIAGWYTSWPGRRSRRLLRDRPPWGVSGQPTSMNGVNPA